MTTGQNIGRALCLDPPREDGFRLYLALLFRIRRFRAIPSDHGTQGVPERSLAAAVRFSYAIFLGITSTLFPYVAFRATPEPSWVTAIREPHFARAQTWIANLGGENVYSYR